ncbi:hypothetical protein B0H17DRAFT_1110404 [Mycena rosella]|uniref:MYND-type domain-containing protein n=1 Tax=Mycena rosella TaxID=1033263 RepID=A0AAD7BQF7_MYCRO|nr:hypothetical protein B0H17DRAFT_1110404 [Mycena rosella]
MDADATLCFGTGLRMIMDLSDSTPAILPALLSRGIVPALVRTVCVFEWEYIPAEIVSVCMRMLLRLMACDPDHRHVLDALRAGRLQAIVASIPMEIEHVRDLLTRVLPAHTVYPPVLTKLRRIPPAVDKIIEAFDPEVLRSPLFEAWRAFYDLVIERTKLQMVFDLTSLPPQLACDNMECAKISAKTEFQRCSGCRSASYCSIECQRRDWKEGGHRAECERRHGRRVGGALNPRDHLFLRELLHHDYETRRNEIIRLQLDFTDGQAARAAEDPWLSSYTSFDYTAGRAEVAVLPISKLKKQ